MITKLRYLTQKNERDLSLYSKQWQWNLIDS